jgi:hypothetical protein
MVKHNDLSRVPEGWHSATLSPRGVFFHFPGGENHFVMGDFTLNSIGIAGGSNRENYSGAGGTGAGFGDEKRPGRTFGGDRTYSGSGVATGWGWFGREEKQPGFKISFPSPFRTAPDEREKDMLDAIKDYCTEKVGSCEKGECAVYDSCTSKDFNNPRFPDVNGAYQTLLEKGLVDDV